MCILRNAMEEWYVLSYFMTYFYVPISTIVSGVL